MKISTCLFILLLCNLLVSFTFASLGARIKKFGKFIKQKFVKPKQVSFPAPELIEVPTLVYFDSLLGTEAREAVKTSEYDINILRTEAVEVTNVPLYGGIYNGLMWRDLPFGYGILTFKSAEMVFNGHWRASKLKDGNVCFKNGIVVRGQMTIGEMKSTYFFKPNLASLIKISKSVQVVAFEMNHLVLRGKYTGRLCYGIPCGINGHFDFVSASSIKSSFTGTWNKGLPSNGIIKYKNPITIEFSEYRGDVKIDMYIIEPNGIGIMLYKNGNSFEGTWSDGDRKNGELITKHFKFTGDFEKAQCGCQPGRSYTFGRGVIEFNNGDVFDGIMYNGFQLKGKMTYLAHPFYLSYEGYIGSDGMFDDTSATLIYRNGNTYTGSFMDGKRDSGTLFFPNGDKFVGLWYNNYEIVNKFRQGTLTFSPLHQKYEFFIGAMKKNLFWCGELRFKNGNTFKGTFTESGELLFGKFILPDGYTYTGFWNVDIDSRPGLLTLLDGTEKIFVPQGEGNLCSVCLNSYKDNDKIALTECYHVFHEHCIDGWIRSQGANKRCAVCVQKIDKSKFKKSLHNSNILVKDRSRFEV